MAAPPVARIFGKEVLAKDLVAEADLNASKKMGADLAKWTKETQCEALRSRVWAAVFDDYMKKYRLEPSKAEIEGCARSMQAASNDIPETRGLPLDIEFATMAVRNWKRDAALYREYGGRMIFQQFGLEPIDAWRKVLEKYEAEKAFVVTDPALKECVYAYFKQRFLEVGSEDVKDFLSRAPLCR